MNISEDTVVLDARIGIGVTDTDFTRDRILKYMRHVLLKYASVFPEWFCEWSVLTGAMIVDGGYQIDLSTLAGKYGVIPPSAIMITDGSYPSDSSTGILLRKSSKTALSSLAMSSSNPTHWCIGSIAGSSVDPQNGAYGNGVFPASPSQSTYIRYPVFDNATGSATICECDDDLYMYVVLREIQQLYLEQIESDFERAQYMAKSAQTSLVDVKTRYAHQMQTLGGYNNLNRWDTPNRLSS